VLKNAFSYFSDDLVFVDSNSALVLEPSGSRVVPLVLELAAGQLLEFRYYDGLLDRELARVYQVVEKTPRIVRSPFGALARQVLRRFMELTEFTERVDNALKVTDDVYLARVYGAALDLFRATAWRRGIERKLEIFRETYAMLNGEAQAARSELLEIVIIIVIVAELFIR